MRNNTKTERGFNLASRYTAKAEENPYFGINPNDYTSNKKLSFDSIVLTVLMGLAIIIGIGFFASSIAISNPALGAVLTIASFIALIAMWGIVFFKRQIKYPKVLFLVFNVLEGFLLGVATGTIGSMQFGQTSGWEIVGQAVTGTVIIFLLCLFLYAQNIIRFAENSKARQVLYMVIGGFGLLYIVNFVISLFTGNNLLWGNGIVPIIVAIVALIIASLSIIDDFGEIQRHVHRGAHDKEKWLLSLSLLSGIIWVYVELLRLLSSLASRE